MSIREKIKGLVESYKKYNEPETTKARLKADLEILKLRTELEEEKNKLRGKKKIMTIGGL